jgi:hypothetical protein
VHDEKKHSTIYTDFLQHVILCILVLRQLARCVQEIVEVFSKQDHKGRSNHPLPSVFEPHLKFQAPGELLLYCMISKVWLP